MRERRVRRGGGRGEGSEVGRECWGGERGWRSVCGREGRRRVKAGGWGPKGHGQKWLGPNFE